MSEVELRARWLRDFPGHDAVYLELLRHYTGRAYHNINHLADCFDQMERFAPALDNSRAVATAIWFHDVIYDPTRSDNEARSADLADHHLRAIAEPDPFVAQVHDLILDTRHAAPPTTTDGAYLVDIDLSILGRPPEVFDAYDRAIRLEYAHVPDDAYRTGRAKVLRSFLARDRIYHTRSFRDLYESPARANLTQAIARLTSPHI